MAATLNRLQLIGRLGQNPELRYTQGGTAVCNFSVATDETYINKAGEKVPGVEWHSVQVWDKVAENCSRYLHKGSLIYVEGKLTSRTYTDKAGVERRVWDVRAQTVQFLDKREDSQGPSQQAQYANSDSYMENGRQQMAYTQPQSQPQAYTQSQPSQPPRNQSSEDQPIDMDSVPF